MPEEPAPLVVSLVDRNPVDPGLETALAPEIIDVPEDLQENFLNHVRGIRRVVQEAQSQIIHRLLKSG